MVPAAAAQRHDTRMLKQMLMLDVIPWSIGVCDAATGHMRRMWQPPLLFRFPR